MTYRLLLVAVVCLCAYMTGVAETPQPQHDKTFGLPLTLSQSAQISYLAAQPSAEDSYTLYGHAGLRVWDAEQGIDVTFNYGIFNFTDDFSLRFTQGKTDYIVLPIATSDYMSEYQSRGVIRELVLNTDSTQRAHLWRLLIENAQPENRTYRYNAFRNNCSTRPLDLYFATLTDFGKLDERGSQLTFVLDSVPGITPLPKKTWREAINELEASSPWLVLGTDLAMGPELDEKMSIRDRFFIPMEAARLLPHLAMGIVTPDQEIWGRPVQQTLEYGEPRPIAPAGLSVTHPLVIFSLILLLSIG
ncbi:lipoprotein N-acyltransferase Lnb domain-containing protein, partial [Porphyromonas sp.]